ncbi:hypothetical protein [uncultured Rubinisphaera sp.]
MQNNQSFLQWIWNTEPWMLIVMVAWWFAMIAFIWWISAREA